MFFLFFKQGLRHRGEVRAIFFIIALILVPLLALVYFVGGWEASQSKDFSQVWWVLRIQPEGAESPSSLNLITAGLFFSLLFVGASGLVAFFSWYYRVTRKSHLLAIHRLLIKLVVLLIGLMIYLKHVGIDLTPLWVGMGAASIIIGIALQEPLTSLFTGVALDVEGVFRRGEWIRLGGEDGVVGKVVEKNWRTTKLLTLDDELVTIPNRKLGSETILNYHQPGPGHVHRLYVGTSYNDPPVKVKEILRTILIREPRIAKHPSPLVRTIKYNDFSIDYELKFWIKDYGKHPSISDAVMTHIWYAFKFYGIEIPFPIRTVHMKERDHLAAEAEGVSEKIVEIKGFLQTLPYFDKHLNHKDFEFIAHNCFQRVYSPGEYVIHKGEIGDALYIVREGWCRVVLPQNQERRINPGEYFGEMGLMGHLARTADVISGQGESTVIRIDRECMQVLFKRYLSLKEEFERVKDERMEDSGLKPAAEPVMRTPLIRRLIKETKDFLIPW